MVTIASQSVQERLAFVLDFAWQIFFERVISGRITINKESSMQLHYSVILHSLGELLCTRPEEKYFIELESSYKKKNIDIACSLQDTKSAIELKCFRKSSNRAVDIDMYNVLSDIERLMSFDEFQVRKFICLSDNPFYMRGPHTGHAKSVSIQHGTKYAAVTPVRSSWSGKWKNSDRDRELVFKHDFQCNWKTSSGWSYMIVDVSAAATT